MHVVGTQVHDDQNDVGPIWSPLAVTQQLLVRDRMKVQAPIALQGGILTTDAIYVANKFSQTVRSFKIPLPDLIFLRMQILFAPRFTRNMLTELERGAVNPIT